jgi:hypothetical protein
MKIIHPKQFKEIRIIIRIQRNIERINIILIKWLYYKELSKKRINELLKIINRIKNLIWKWSVLNNK